ncbi:MAG TPA: S41 family peptidase [Anaerolineales bacterium]
MDRTLKAVFFGLLVIFIGVAAFGGGLAVGHILPAGARSFVQPLASAGTQSPDQQSTGPQNTDTLFAPFWQAWKLVHEEFVNQPVDDTKLMQGAIRGMMQALGDKHSSYLDPKEYQQANSELSGSYEGIGAYVDVGGDYLTITSPIPGSPAEKAGLKPGDKIIKINGEDMTGVDPEVARSKVLGPAGSSVHLTVQRSGQAQPLEVDVKREKIVVKTATGKMLDNGIGYIQLTTFGENTGAELKDALKEIMAQKPKGIILDLRYNGGGYLQTAVEVASQFLDDGPVLYEQYGDGQKKSYDVLPGGLATDTKVPMVVLVNEWSASASEIVAGALQDAGRAKLVGVKSYGKGSVQNWVPLENNQGAVRVTIAKWLTPGGRTIEGQGLTPDVYVAMDLANLKAGTDPQLDAAVKTLEAMAAGNPIPTSMPTATPSVVPTATP